MQLISILNQILKLIEERCSAAAMSPMYGYILLLVSCTILVGAVMSCCHFSLSQVSDASRKRGKFGCGYSALRIFRSSAYHHVMSQLGTKEEIKQKSSF